MKHFKNQWYAVVLVVADSKDKVDYRNPANITALSESRDLAYKVAGILNKELPESSGAVMTVDEILQGYGNQTASREYAICKLTLSSDDLANFNHKIIGQPGFHLMPE